MNNANEVVEKEDFSNENQLNNENVSTSENLVKVEKRPKSILSIFMIIFGVFIVFLLIVFCGFTVFNMFNTNIISGVFIKDIDVSNLSPSDAKYQLDNYLKKNIPEEITVKHGDFEATISLTQMEATFDTKTACDRAFKVGRTGNIFENNLSVLSTMFGNVNIEPKVVLDEKSLSKNLQDMSAQLPDAVIQSSYYIEGNELLVTSGKTGNIVDVDATLDAIKNSIYNFSCVEQPVEIVVKSQEPEPIDVEKIYNEIKKDPVDAYYTTNPFSVHPSENGVDFNISLDDAKSLVTNEVKEEYSIPLKFISPKVTTNMIGTEAFPDLLSSYSTRFSTSDRNRSTNITLAARKVNGTVLMPGETFSYNKVVGARTIAAGYKEAGVYVNGKVTTGIGGGICQVSSTLYNAVIYANLDIVQRTNHMFVSSYVPISRDATVSYGSLDFQFKNNRNYPIKIVCSVSGGVCSFQIFGMKQDDDYQVEISSYQTGSSATSIYSVAYKILKRNGTVVSKQLLSKDTYKKH